MSIRSRLLNWCFNLLYGPLVFLHEPAGTCLFGRSWDGRRADLAASVEPNGQVLDVGSGAGHLLVHLSQHGFSATGIEPSSGMLGRARQRGLPVVRGHAEALPVPTSSVASIVVSYPGPWIRQPAVWTEFDRVLQPGGSIAVLLGGTVERGRGAFVRSALSRLLYGSAPRAQVEFHPPLPGTGGLQGSLGITEDQWGAVICWRGKKDLR